MSSTGKKKTDLISLEQFRQFASKAQKLKEYSLFAVIYTRVSSKDQDANTSLPYQKKICEEYAKRKGFTVVAYFGGTHESAKTDDRKEFNRMLRFLKESKGQVCRIIVLSMERFSRTGGNAIHIKDKLKEQNILIESATQETDGSTPSGDFQQNLYLLFGKMENELRRQKTLAGMQEMARQGYLPNRAPVGYRHVKGADWDNRIVIDEKKGPLIKKAFELKAEQGKSHTEIAEILNNAGLKLDRKRLTVILKDPFYCGILSNGYLPGEIREGKHPKLISRELFLRANNETLLKPHGERQPKERPEFPLKQFVKCDCCEKPLTAYHVKIKNAMYYKCNTQGCKLNRNVVVMHSKFISKLGKYSVDPKSKKVAQKIMTKVFNRVNHSNQETGTLIQKQYDQVESNIKKLNDKFISDQIGKNAYDETLKRYVKEKGEIEEQLKKFEGNLSNLAEYVEFSIRIGSQLPSMWKKSGLMRKKQLQNLVFPEGLGFNKEIDDYLTPRVNTFFKAIDFVSGKLAENKSGISEKDIENSALVARTFPHSNFLTVLPRIGEMLLFLNKNKKVSHISKRK